MSPARARASIPPELLSSLRNLIESASGVVLGDAKLPHLSAVVRGRMEACGIPDAPGYMEFLSEGEKGTAERRDLVSELLVGETSFFRTPVLFHSFEKAILPGMLEQGFVSPLPVWCAGCATGEEAYSVAIAALPTSTPGSSMRPGRGSIPRRRCGTFRAGSRRPGSRRRRTGGTV
jgi:chemotaxis methyl-accepting protein methylase